MVLIEHNCSILRNWHVSKLRYRAHDQKYKLLLHCKKSLKCVDIEIFALKMDDEHNC